MHSRSSIVHLLPAEPFGGLQTLVIELAAAQKSSGKAVEIVLLNHSERVEARCVAAGIVPVVCRGTKLMRLAKLARILRQRPASILHSHCEPVWASALLASRSRRWVVHLHIYALQKSLRDRFGNFLRQLFARHFIAITRSVGDSYVALGLVDRGRLSTVYNGLDFAPTQMRGLTSGLKTPQLIGFVGRAVREKGLFDFIEVADLLRGRPDLRFVIAGEGADLKAAVAEIEARSLQRHITVLGFVEDMGAVWPSLDVLLMLSEREPFGLVILEAIAAGVAVIGYELSSGGSEIMSEVPGCHMVEAFSATGLAREVLRVLEDEASTETELERGQEVVRSRFSMKRMEANVAMAYGRL